MENPGNFLVIDDNRFFGELCKEIIRKKFNSSRVDYAKNGLDALEKIRGRDYCAIISDVDMPCMDGIAFYEAVKEESPLLAKKVGFMSGKLNDFHTTFFIREGRPYLPKPFTDDAFAGLVSRILDAAGVCADAVPETPRAMTAQGQDGP